MKNLNNKNIVVFGRDNLKSVMVNMLKEQKIPLTMIFKHIAFLAQMKYFDHYSIDSLNPKLDKFSVDANIMRNLIAEFQSPQMQSIEKFSKEFVNSLWNNKINKPKPIKDFKNKNTRKERV